MGCGDSKNLFEDVKNMLDKFKVDLEHKERYIQKKDKTGIKVINEQIEILSRKIKNELLSLNSVIVKKDEVENFQFMNGKFQFYLNKNQILNSL